MVKTKHKPVKSRKTKKKIPVSDSLIERSWTNLKNDNALESLSAFAKSRKTAHNLRDLERSLSRIEAFSRTRPLRKIYPRPAYILHAPYYSWCTDLVEMEHKGSNKGYRYILVLLDQFSRKVALSPLKRKNKELTKIALEKAVKRLSNNYKNVAHFLTSDGGGEFGSRHVLNYLKRHGIQHRVITTGMKSSLCERFNLSLERWLYKAMTLKKSKVWWNLLPRFETMYNRKKHSVTLFAPERVNSKNASEVFRNAYRRLVKKLPRKKPVFDVGDTVRIAEKHNIFQKKYKPLFSKEIYRVVKVQNTFPIVTYRVATLTGTEVQKTFVSQELSPATLVQNGG